MPKSYLNFEEGDILILELPFTDLIGKKLRPVLVLSSKELNKTSNDLIVAKISSSHQLSEYEIELNLEDLEEGKVKKTSYVHCHSIFTVEKVLVSNKAGKIGRKKLQEVKEKLIGVFGLKYTF